ncbi:hypothetical protein R1flu_012452 [Riccia fluitans]|uniref:Uncharacterized protein n=1 Tax=Riccia fluitans TaxID=41844 RepID=A0ABD1ZAM5_9MARC
MARAGHAGRGQKCLQARNEPSRAFMERAIHQFELATDVESHERSDKKQPEHKEKGNAKDQRNECKTTNNGSRNEACRGRNMSRSDKIVDTDYPTSSRLQVLREGSTLTESSYPIGHLTIQRVSVLRGGREDPQNYGSKVRSLRPRSNSRWALRISRGIWRLASGRVGSAQ